MLRPEGVGEVEGAGGEGETAQTQNYQKIELLEYL
jgi:hypothetical protein